MGGSQSFKMTLVLCASKLLVQIATLKISSDADLPFFSSASAFHQLRQTPSSPAGCKCHAGGQAFFVCVASSSPDMLKESFINGRVGKRTDSQQQFPIVGYAERDPHHLAGLGSVQTRS